MRILELSAPGECGPRRRRAKRPLHPRARLTERGRDGWHARVTRIAEKLGWWAWHDRSARVNKPGWPDLVLVRERVIYVENKREGVQPSKDQREVLLRLVKAGSEVHIWHPSDERRVIDVLRRRGHGERLRD